MFHPGNCAFLVVFSGCLSLPYFKYPFVTEIVLADDLPARLHLMNVVENERIDEVVKGGFPKPDRSSIDYRDYVYT